MQTPNYEQEDIYNNEPQTNYQKRPAILRNTPGIVSLVLGIISTVLFFMTMGLSVMMAMGVIYADLTALVGLMAIGTLIAGLPGIIIGIIAVVNSIKYALKKASAILGLLLSSFGFIAMCAIIVLGLRAIY